MNYMKMLCRRTLELDEIYTKIRVLTGLNPEQLLEMFMKGYELTPPDPQGSLSEFMLHEDSDVKEETENTNNAHIKIQYNYEELSVAEICERLKNAESRAEKAEKERDAAVKTIFQWTGCPECKYWNSQDEWCEKHDREANGNGGCNSPEWCGIKEE